MSTFLSRMNEARQWAAAAHHPRLGFMVSGGLSGSTYLPSSELSTDMVTFNAYTSIPFGLLRHCVVAMDRNDGDFFLAGGVDGSNRVDRAFIHSSSNWVEVRKMPTARDGTKSN